MLPPIEQGQWQLGSSSPIVAPSAGWEGTVCVEASAAVIDGSIWLYYRGGPWNGPFAIGLIRCPTSSDPRLAASWTKDPGNPIYGNGVGGEALSASQPWVVHVDGTDYLYYTRDFLATSTACVATATDHRTFTKQGGDILTRPAGVTQLGNRTVWREADATWYMLLEGRIGAGPWRIYLYTSSSPLSGWVIGNGGAALGGLEMVAGASAGGPKIATIEGLLSARIGGRLHVWLHGTATAGILPTQINDARATDPSAWTLGAPLPVLGIAHGLGFEVDQVAGPCVLQSGRYSYMFFDGDDNVGQTARIGIAYYPGTLADLLLARSSALFFGSPGGDVFGGGSLMAAYAQATLAADVELTVAGTYYDGPSIALAQGTWLVWASVLAQYGTIATNLTVTAKLTDGATVYGSGESSSFAATGGAGTSGRSHMALGPALVVVGVGGATLKIQAASDVAGAVKSFLRAACIVNGAPANATQIAAIQVA